MKRCFFRLISFATISAMLVLPTAVFAAVPAEREVWIPKARHGEARTLVDPGPEGLLGEYKLLTLKLPEFIATYQGPKGKLVIQIHPPNEPGASEANWTGERVALTVRATTFDRALLEKALAAVITIVKKREGRWGWMWRSVSRKKIKKDPFGNLYRGLAYGKRGTVETRLSELKRNGEPELVVMLDGLELAYRAGEQEFARVLAGQLARVSEEKLTRGEQNKALLQANRLLLARAFALAGRVDQLERIQGGILGSQSVCRATVIARALHAAGRKTEAMEFVEEKILGRTDSCASALDLAVTLRLHNEDLSGAKDLLKLHKGRLTNHPATFLAQARIKFAGGEVDAGVDLLRTALRFNPKESEVYDLLAVGLLLQKKDVGSLTEAKKRREEKLKRLSAQLYAGMLCAAYRDQFCVDAALDVSLALAKDKEAVPLLLLGSLSSLVSKQAAPHRERLNELWKSSPFLMAPLVIERLSDVFSDRPSIELIGDHAGRVYGPGIGRQLEKLVSARESVPVNTQPSVGAEAPSQEATVDSEVQQEETEDEFLFPSWLLLTMGGVLALLGIVAVLKQRQNSQPSTEEE